MGVIQETNKGEWKDASFNLVQSSTLNFVGPTPYSVNTKRMDLGQSLKDLQLSLD